MPPQACVLSAVFFGDLHRVSAIYIWLLLAIVRSYFFSEMSDHFFQECEVLFSFGIVRIFCAARRFSSDCHISMAVFRVSEVKDNIVSAVELPSDIYVDHAETADFEIGEIVVQVAVDRGDLLIQFVENLFPESVSRNR